MWKERGKGGGGKKGGRERKMDMEVWVWTAIREWYRSFLRYYSFKDLTNY